MGEGGGGSVEAHGKAEMDDSTQVGRRGSSYCHADVRSTGSFAEWFKHDHSDSSKSWSSGCLAPVKLVVMPSKPARIASGQAMINKTKDHAMEAISFKGLNTASKKTAKPIMRNRPPMRVQTAPAVLSSRDVMQTDTTSMEAPMMRKRVPMMVMARVAW